MVKSTKDAAYWKKQIELSIAKRRTYEKWWDANLTAYAPTANQDPERYGQDINTNRDFVLVERKKADLFYQRPDVTLSPSPLLEQPMAGPPDQTGQPTQIPQTVALSAHQTIVNEKLGPDGVDATRMVHQTLFDVLCPQGTGFTMMGYEQFGPFVSDPRDPSGKTLVQVPVASQCFWHHFSGKQAVIPHDYLSTEWDRAPYLGHQFKLPLTKGNRAKFKLPPNFTGSKSDGKQHYDHGTSNDEGDDVFTGVELWYRSALYRDDITHPEHLTHLVMVDGLDEPVIHVDCPYQTLLPNGTLSPDSLVGFPIHPLNVRSITDSAYPPSDSTMIRPLVNELNVYRLQQVQFRDAAVLKFIANGDVLPPEALAKIVRSPIGGITVVPGEAFHGEGSIKPLDGGTMPRETFTGQQAIDDDIARTTAIDASGAGVQSSANQTATEAQIQQGNANARLDFERGVVLQWYVKGVTKFSTLIQRYLPVEQAAQIVGPQLAGLWDAWRKTVPSSLAFTAMPDSALRVDQAVDRKSSQDLYSFLANDPYIQKGRAKLLEKLLRKHHIDPTGIVAAPDPAKPEPPKLALSFKGEDLVGPQAPIVLEILQQQGIQISPQAVQQSQGMLLQAEQLAAQTAQAEANTKHGGKLAQQESLSKHHADNTGGMQNTGAPAAMGAAGGMIS